MNIQANCQACKTTYTVEWHDYAYAIHDVENDEYEENEPTHCPFCGERIDEHDEDEWEDEL